MRNAVQHPASERPSRPAPRVCSKCYGRAIFTEKGQPICGPCFDKVIEADDAKQQEAGNG